MIKNNKKNKITKGTSLSSLSKLNITGDPKDLSKNMDKYIYNKKDIAQSKPE